MRQEPQAASEAEVICTLPFLAMAAFIALSFWTFRTQAYRYQSMLSDIFQFPFRFNPGTIEENVGMSVDLLIES
jgi:hypothetical protein